MIANHETTDESLNSWHKADPITEKIVLLHGVSKWFAACGNVPSQEDVVV